ncbi:hypothetical protein D3C85_1723990 [compost metagenome]
MVETAQPPLLHPAQGQRGAAVHAQLLHHAHAALAIAKGDQVLAQQAHAQRLRIALDLSGGAYRMPVAAHHLTHRRAGADAAKQLIVLAVQHG